MRQTWYTLLGDAGSNEITPRNVVLQTLRDYGHHKNAVWGITARNRGDLDAPLDLIPQLWFRNTWSWGCREEGCDMRPRLKRDGDLRIRLDEPTLGRYELSMDHVQGAQVELLFTENETNAARLFGSPNAAPFVKDAFHEHVVENLPGVVNPAGQGTKAAFHVSCELGPGETKVLQLRLRPTEDAPRERFGAAFRRTGHRSRGPAVVFAVLCFVAHVPVRALACGGWVVLGRAPLGRALSYRSNNDWRARRSACARAALLPVDCFQPRAGHSGSRRQLLFLTFRWLFSP